MMLNTLNPSTDIIITSLVDNYLTDERSQNINNKIAIMTIIKAGNPARVLLA
jgi:hypothetical protein